MKTLLVCLIAAAVLAAAALPAAALAAEASPWQLKNPVGPQQTQREDLRAVCALDGGTAWAVGAGNAVYFTHDGGATWEAQATGAPRDAVWKAVRFADFRHGLIAGEAGGKALLYATADGGRTWAPRTVPAGVRLSDLELYGPQYAWAAGAHGVVLRSSDGGATWQRSRAGAADLGALDFTSAASGVAMGAGGSILWTADGGKTWTRAKAPVRAGLDDLTMRTSQVGWAVGEKGLVLRTSDGGRTWQRQQTPAGAGACVAVDFASVERGWVVTASGGLLGTSDGGRTWRRERHGMGALRLRDIDVPTHFADRAAVAASTGGASAARGDAPADPDAAAPDRAFVVGDGGAIGKYTEPGSSVPTNVVAVTPIGSPCPDASTLSFDLSDYSITDSVSWDGFDTEVSYGSLNITVTCDRSGSSGPAEWFTSQCNGIEYVKGQSTTDTPKELNFAFTGTFFYGAYPGGQAGQVPMALGQGHESTDNNWWIGSAQFHRVYNGSELLDELAYDFFIVTDDGSDSGFNVNFAD